VASVATVAGNGPTLLSFVAHLHAVERDMRAVNPAIVARACQLVAAEAKRVIGTYDYGWPQLKPETLARKFYDTPLLETGEMRDSIEWHAEGLRGEVGSNNDKAVFHEFGTSRIPPRPFLGPAAAEMGLEIEKMAAKAVLAVVLGKGLHSSEMLELLHLLKHVGHHVKEAADKALETDEERARRR
jgi:HK97 gp10 family phage protein